MDPLIESLDPSRRKKKCKDIPPHASFRTRKQEIDIELGTTGNVEKVSKANVAVSSSSGPIKVKLVSTIHSIWILFLLLTTMIHNSLLCTQLARASDLMCNLAMVSFYELIITIIPVSDR